jgi:hypothetical protein
MMILTSSSIEKTT